MVAVPRAAVGFESFAALFTFSQQAVFEPVCWLMAICARHFFYIFSSRPHAVVVLLGLVSLRLLPLLLGSVRCGGREKALGNSLKEAPKQKSVALVVCGGG